MKFILSVNIPRSQEDDTKPGTTRTELTRIAHSAALSAPSASAIPPVKALKMMGPNPLVLGQRGIVKTTYFDPKTYSTKDLRDFHRLTQGLNADIRRMVEETEQIRQKSVRDAEELNRLRNLAGLDDTRQWLFLLVIGCAMMVSVLMLAAANMMLVWIALKTRGFWNYSASSGKPTLLMDDSASEV